MNGREKRERHQRMEINARKRKQREAYAKRMVKAKSDHAARHSHGAASSVRHIDPASVQVSLPSVAAIPPNTKARALANAADGILMRDAMRPGNKRRRKDARNKIALGRYSGPNK